MNAKEISDATLESVTPADNDLMLIYDTSEGTTGKATIADIAPKVAENIDIATLPAVTPAADDVLMIRDTSAGTTGKATIADIAPKVAENIDIATLPAVTPAADDVLMIRDTSAGTTGKATIADIISSVGWTDVSNEISYNPTYVDEVRAYTDGHLFEISIHYLTGTPDQTSAVILPNKYCPKPGIITTLASFYMNGVDSQQNIVGFVNSLNIEFRCNDYLKGPAGAYLYGIWGI